MSVRRVVGSCVLVLLLFLAAVPAADAQRACADVYQRCRDACTQQYGGGILSPLMLPGCVSGCSIGYLWCAAS